ncbi:MAG TPA: GspE/PulE family protein [Candidatus Limnocylindria bacterium]|nr:GspE/PulE family protein [Candidatus Limnocylindria bacterium]
MTIALHTQDDTPVVHLVDAIIRKAIAHAASDVHFQSTDNQLRVRYRIDGMLYDQRGIDKTRAQQVLSRLKVLAHLDVTEKRIPQDGKFRMQVDQQPVELRVSTFPTLHGEKIVVRILDRTQTKIDLDHLGLHEDMLRSFKQLLSCASGFFLVTGPTGSGKTTTLYAGLSMLNSPEKNIITLEDPVEYNVHGITQGQIHPEAGFTFEKGIRAILRQDPDIVMVGEIRDRQTAQIAIEAALTGHVVVSTLHTNDAPSVIMRLMDMGIEPFLLNAALSGVLAQRLARKICTQCRIPYEPDHEERLLLKRFALDIPHVYKGQGCDMCLNLGHKGRIGIFELLEPSVALRSLIMQQPAWDTVYNQACADGMMTLAQDGARKVAQGVITLTELARVLA